MVICVVGDSLSLGNCEITSLSLISHNWGTRKINTAAYLNCINRFKKIFLAEVKTCAVASCLFSVSSCLCAGVQLYILSQRVLCGVWPLHPRISALLPMLHSQSERPLTSATHRDWNSLRVDTKPSLPYHLQLVSVHFWWLKTFFKGARCILSTGGFQLSRMYEAPDCSEICR